MHPSALSHARLFFETYATAFENPAIVEIGSQDVNGSLRDVAPERCRYTGLDFVAGKGVDLVMDDPYALPLEDGSADIVVSSSCFEHSEMFWLVFLEILRVMKPDGLFYLNVPSNGDFHRWPVDCWRFYPDSARALVTWARRNALHPLALESFTGVRSGGHWNDFVAVFLKHEAEAGRHPNRMVDRTGGFTNGLRHGSDEVENFSRTPEDQKTLATRLRRWYWRKTEDAAFARAGRKP